MASDIELPPPDYESLEIEPKSDFKTADNASTNNNFEDKSKIDIAYNIFAQLHCMFICRFFSRQWYDLKHHGRSWDLRGSLRFL